MQAGLGAQDRARLGAQDKDAVLQDRDAGPGWGRRRSMRPVSPCLHDLAPYAFHVSSRQTTRVLRWAGKERLSGQALR